MQMSVMEFGDTKLVFEVRGLVGKHKDWPNKVGNEFHTTEGMITDGKFFPKSGDAPIALKDDPNLEVKVAPGGAFGSFINAVRSRKIEDCNCDAEVGHYSAALCHLSNISYRLSSKEASAAEPYEEIGEHKEIYKTYEAIQENLKAAEVDLANVRFRHGRVINVDVEAEAIKDDAEANALLTRVYREPFIVPDEV